MKRPAGLETCESVRKMSRSARSETDLAESACLITLSGRLSRARIGRLVEGGRGCGIMTCKRKSHKNKEVGCPGAAIQGQQSPSSWEGMPMEGNTGGHGTVAHWALISCGRLERVSALTNDQISLAIVRVVLAYTYYRLQLQAFAYD